MLNLLLSNYVRLFGTRDYILMQSSLIPQLYLHECQQNSYDVSNSAKTFCRSMLSSLKEKGYQVNQFGHRGH